MLCNKEKFMKPYFQELIHYKKNEQHEEIGFEFPVFSSGVWKIEGFIRGEHIILKGTKKEGRIHYKKYNYSVVYKKIREDYQGWAADKFYF